MASYGDSFTLLTPQKSYPYIAVSEITFDHCSGWILETPRSEMKASDDHLEIRRTAKEAVSHGENNSTARDNNVSL
jgi:hypothetical protein